jgi:multiple RNA-binding domain-containing protein 1
LSSEPNIPLISASPTATIDSKKRKRGIVDESNPKLREFLEVMKPGSKGLEILSGEALPASDVIIPTAIEEDESDGEYEILPTRPEKRQMTDTDGPIGFSGEEGSSPKLEDQIPNHPPSEVPSVTPHPEIPLSADDDDWLRSRTNRVLDLIDDEEMISSNPPQPRPVSDKTSETPSHDSNEPLPANEGVKKKRSESIKPKEVESVNNGSEVKNEGDTALATIRQTARLFLRNLSYQVTDDHLRRHFEQFGNLEEVRW